MAEGQSCTALYDGFNPWDRLLQRQATTSLNLEVLTPTSVGECPGQADHVKK
jgi:hypothetical protein